MPWHSTEAIIDVCTYTHCTVASGEAAFSRSWHRWPWPWAGGGKRPQKWPRSAGSDLSGDQEPGLEGITVGQEPRSVDRLLQISKRRKSKCLQSQAEARQVWSREAKSLWSQQDSICPAARQLLAGDTYLAVRAGHFSQAELFCFVKYRDLFIINNIIFTM